MKTYLSRAYAVVAQHWQTGEDLQEIADWLNECDLPWHGHLASEMGSDITDDTQAEWLNVRDQVMSICFDLTDEEFDRGRWFVAYEVDGEHVYENLTDEVFKKRYDEKLTSPYDQRTEQPCG